MTAFSKTARLAFTALCLWMLAFPAAAQENRTAGTMPVSVPHKKESAEDNAPAKKAEKAENAENKGKPDTVKTVEKEEVIDPAETDAANAVALSSTRSRNTGGPVDFDELESYGLLTNLSDGGLGIDVWEGSNKSFILQLVESMNASARFPVTQDLLRRALLTRNDPDLMSPNPAPSQGRDFLTLRIEKLTQMGAFADAAKLYTENPDRPYHERLARAGITAMLLDGQMPLACLETLALEKNYDKTEAFWQQAEEICGYFMGKDGGVSVAPREEAPAAEPSSKIIGQILEKKHFRYAISGADDFESLSYAEKAILIHQKRMDYSRIKADDTTRFSPLSASLLLKDENLPQALRFKLLSHLVKGGYQPPESLAAFYKSSSFKEAATDSNWLAGYEKTKGWERLSFLFQAAAANEGAGRTQIIDNALVLNEEYGIYALTPFADFLNTANPANLSPESIRTGIKLYAFTGRKVPTQWEASWNSVKTGKASDMLLDDAYKITMNTRPKQADKPVNSSSSADPAAENSDTMLAVIKEKLDNNEKFHKYTASTVYEKNIDLTLGFGYVMPIVSLIDNLEKAAEDRRLGEVILLSSIALNEVPPEKKNAGILRKVLYGFETVGLTKEARELAMEAVLSSEREKEN